MTSLFLLKLSYLTYFLLDILFRQLSKYLNIINQTFRALSDPNRRKILEVLKERDMTVNQIAQHLSITGATLSHHLEALKHANLVISQRKGQHIEYSLNTSVFEEILNHLVTLFK